MANHKKEDADMNDAPLRQMAKREGGLNKDGGISKNWAKAKLKNPRIGQATKKRLMYFLNTRPWRERKENPVRPSKHERLNLAGRLYKRFRGGEPKFIDEYDMDFPDVVMEIGRCDGILYTTVRDGKKEQYIHEFTGKSCPILASSWDGKQIILVGGHYDFTAEGIKDRK